MSWSEEQEKTDEILSKFERSLSGSKYKLIKHYFHRNRYSGMRTDIDGLITTEQGYPYCIIDIKINLQGPTTGFAKKKVLRDFNIIRAKFAIITDGKKYLFFEYSKDKDFKDKKYDEIIEKILPSSKEEKDLNTDPTTYLDLICECFNQIFNPFKIKNNDICFDNNKFSITKDKEKKLVETLFNKNLFKSEEDFPPKVVFYRYTSLNTVFEILRDCEIKMFGIAAMNDASEVDYIEKNIDPSGTQPLNPEINKIFIMSCSLDKDDDLTQWRLYGDDAKGVCLKFEVKEKTTPFVIRKIEYVAETSEQISKLRDLVKRVYDKTGYAFIFNAIHEWCHFIKPKDYKDETEIRLLYKSSKKHPDLWGLANSTNIINPYVKFNFEDFPLKLTEIKLGPKCPNPTINKFQLETLLKNIPNLNGTEVSLSAIKNYR